ncbi:Nup358, partial [Drosophila busckii]
MFKTRKELDEHVHGFIGKIPPGPERDLKGYSIARLYVKINEFPKAIEYLTAYLRVKDEYSGHKLIAQCYKEQTPPDYNKVLDHYQRCIQLNPRQPDVIKDACQLLNEHAAVYNSERAAYWIDLAKDEPELRESDIVYALSLKQRTSTNSGGGDQQQSVELLLHRELIARPQDPVIRVRLMHSYLESKRHDEAFNFAYKTEVESTAAEWQSTEWYEVVWTVLRKCESQKDNSNNWAYWELTLITLERLVQLSLQSEPCLAECTTQLFKFDQYLNKFSLLADKLTANGCRELHQCCVEHFAGQLLLHAATLLFKRELQSKKNSTWSNTIRTALPLLLLGYQQQPFKEKTPHWHRHCSNVQKKLLQFWRYQAAFRCAQLARTLQGCLRQNQDDELGKPAQKRSLWDSSDELLSNIRQQCADKKWRQQLYQMLYTHTDQKLKEQTTYMARDSRLEHPLYEWPAVADIEELEQRALKLMPVPTLMQHVYLALSSDNLAAMQRVHFYDHMQQDCKQGALHFLGCDALSRLDVDIFLYGVVLQAQRKLETMRENFSCQAQQAQGPYMLPYANMVLKRFDLVTADQLKWWKLMLSIYNHAEQLSMEQRATLQCGLEAVRGLNGPHADMILVFQLGNLLENRAERATTSAGLHARIETIYKHGFNMLRRHRQQQLEPFARFFKFSNANASSVWLQTQQLAEKAISYMSARLFKQRLYEEFLEEMRGLQLPMACYMQAEAYRQLAQSPRSPRVARQSYRERRQDCLRQTQHLLLEHVDHPLSTLVEREMRSYIEDDIGQTNDLHNNSSTYEDAQDDYYAEVASNRSRRSKPEMVAAPVNLELENTVKQMSKQLCGLQDDVANSMDAMRQDIKSLTDKFAEKLTLIEDMLKLKIRQETPTRDLDAAAAAVAASNFGLEDLLNIEESLQSNCVTPQNAAAAAVAGMGQDRFFSPGNVNTYGNPMYPNPNQMYNYFANQQAAQFMRGPQPPQSGPNYYGKCLPFAGNAPFMDGLNGLNYGTPQSLVASMPSTPGTGFFNNSPQALSQQMPQQMPQQMQQQLIQQMPQQLPQQLAPQLPPQLAPQLPPVVPALQTPAVLPKPTAPLVVPAPAPASVPSTVVLFNRAQNNQPVEKEPPANVVITSSDPLPKPAMSSAQPTLSVTIPAQHIKPSLVSQTTEPTAAATTSSSNIFSLDKEQSSSMFGDFSNFSFKAQVAQAAAEKQREQAASEAEAELNESSSSQQQADNSAELDYDPRPDFQGIIPLPAEVEVRTGEEDEQVKFTNRAKLYRFAEKEWKERGTGNIKILLNPQGVSRILMRRDQTHKICANHQIMANMSLTTPQLDAEGKSFIWGANDFADEKLTVEKFLVRFKLPETAKEFKAAFDDAVKSAGAGAGSNKQQTAVPTKPQTMFAGMASNSFVTSTPSPATPTPAAAKPKQLEAAKLNSAAPASAVPKSLFGGATTVKTTDAPAPAAASPFANFTFDSKSSTGNYSFASLAAQQPQSTSTSSSSSTTTTTTSTTFTTVQDKTCGGNNSTAFTTAFNFGSQSNSSVSSSSMLQQPTSGTETTDADDAEYVPTAQFTPVIPLPELIKVVTGEEDELVLFEHRAKLLRFDRDASEWKERGIGNMKLLQQKANPSQIRLLMRREQVLKICCNQRLLPETKFNYASNTQNALTWAGQDFAEQEVTTELLCVRFKSADTCKQFYDAVLKAQASMDNEQLASTKPEKAEKVTPPTAEASATKAPAAKGFGDAFKPKAGSWSCQGCYTTNVAEQLYCLACETPKDDTVPPKPAAGALNLSNSTSGGSSKFSFGMPSAGGFSFVAKPATDLSSTTGFSFNTKPTEQQKDAVVTTTTASTTGFTAPAVSSTTSGFGDAFKPKTGSWSCPGCYTSNDSTQLYCLCCEAPKDDTVPKKDNQLGGGLNLTTSTSQKFNFGFGPKTTDATTKDSIASIAPSVSESSSQIDAAKSTGSGIFGSASFSFMPKSSNSFSFAMPTATSSLAQQPKSPAAAAADNNDDDSHVEEEENNAYFAPVIPLPDKIDVKTGEEDEELLYVQRSKLYRLTEEGEWKERGLGDVKILRHKQSKSLRCVMRREQVLKTCLNHVLNADVIYKPKDDKTWLFVVHDYSEGETQLERFALRFKNQEIAQAFHNAVQEALSGTAVAIKDTEEQPAAVGQQQPAAVSKELQELANKVQLNTEFFTSEHKCAGCRGCEPDSFAYGPVSTPTEQAALPMMQPALKMPPAKPKQPTTSVSTPTTPAAAVSPASANRPLLKASTLVSNNNNHNSFGGFSTSVSECVNPTSNSPASTTIASTGGFLFGTTGKTLFGSSASIFGNKLGNQQDIPQAQKSIFGTSIFGSNNMFASNNNSGSTNDYVFGAKQNTFSFGDLAANKTESPKNNKDNVEITLNNSKPMVGFAELAAANSGDDFSSLAAKPIGVQKSSTGGFFGLTHQNDFKNFQSPKSTTQNESSDETNDENYDPHYEPIIALPEEIVLSTGEENEIKLFGERGMLYRYDATTKEWKERGVGEVKILKHKSQKSYRIVMRREQIHKLVLNVPVSKNFSITYMNDQKKSLIWGSLNFAEDPNGVVEKLACRFKKSEMAERFLTIINS